MVDSVIHTCRSVNFRVTSVTQSFRMDKSKAFKLLTFKDSNALITRTHRCKEMQVAKFESTFLPSFSLYYLYIFDLVKPLYD